MTTWTRADLKSRAKETLHRNYWRMVLVGFIMMVATGGFNGGSGRSFSSLQESFSQSSNTSSITGSREIGRDVGNTLNGIQNSMDKSSWAVAGGVAVVVLIIVLVAMVIGAVLSFFLIQPLVVGGRRFFSRSLVEDAQLNEITYAFTHNYMNIVKNMFLMNLFIGLWSLLFVIPGIVKTYEYRMIPYLLGEHPEMSTQELFQTSKDMMRGQKWAAFVLDVSFIGWYFLGAMTCGILFIFWVYPYIWLTEAALFRELSGIDRGYGPQGGMYGQSATNNQWSPYGQSGSNNQWSPYGQSGSNNQGNPYGQSDPYNQGNPYGQSAPNSQGDSYSQSGSYNQGDAYSQNTPYGQGYYSQDDTAGQWQSGTQDSSYNQGNGNVQGDAGEQENPYN